VIVAVAITATPVVHLGLWRRPAGVCRRCFIWTSLL
jgi:hypothetical protein